MIFRIFSEGLQELSGSSISGNFSGVKFGYGLVSRVADFGAKFVLKNIYREKKEAKNYSVNSFSLTDRIYEGKKWGKKRVSRMT